MPWEQPALNYYVLHSFMSFAGDFFLTAELAASERLMILLVGITFHATQKMLPAKNIMSQFIPKITYRFWAGCQCQSAVCVDRSGRLMATDNSQTSHQDYKKLLTNGSSERLPHKSKLPWEFFLYYWLSVYGGFATQKAINTTRPQQNGWHF